MKVKIFKGTEEVAEETINAWLKENPNIVIVQVTQSTQTGTGGVSISIFYAPKKKASK